MEKISSIIESIANEKGLEPQIAQNAVSTALINTAKRIFGEEYKYAVETDQESGELALFQKVQIVEDDSAKLEEEGAKERYLPISKAKELDSELEVGDELTYKVDLNDMGRTAASILYRELEYHIQREVAQKTYESYQKKVGSIISIIVTRVDDNENTYGEYREIKAILPMKSRIKGEKFKVGDTVRCIIRRVYIDKKLGMIVELSRTSPKFLEELLRLEVPEIADGNVIIHKSARIPGERAKVALSSISPNIDPVGATVGTKGIRINAVSQELNGENIDCIEYSAIPEKYVARALSPAIISDVKIEGDKAIVSLASDQKSKAIGRSGINIRLASMLTGYEIELNELEGTATPTQESEPEEKTKSTDALKSLFGES